MTSILAHLVAIPLLPMVRERLLLWAVVTVVPLKQVLLGQPMPQQMVVLVVVLKGTTLATTPQVRLPNHPLLTMG
jgi:hypothetical protein